MIIAANVQSLTKNQSANPINFYAFINHSFNALILSNLSVFLLFTLI
ncbi:hypothetical protein MNBD_BACTEROID01-2587 [hydrothermal vent metagenome]|uniref:Uncharacterized protein n=1 Tax=hydrothermal vent metagenome TaxID=652676 RepID=A0A3B0U592_9ZZZZ